MALLIKRRLQAFEYKSYRRLLHISYRDHVTNEHVRQTVENFVGPQEPLLATVKRRKLAFYGHVTRHSSLCKTVLQGTVEGGRKRGRPRKSWSDNIRTWTQLSTPELLDTVTDRPRWREVSSSSALRSPLRRPRHGNDLT